MAFQQDIAINALWYSSTPDETPATNGISDAIHGAVAVNTTNGNMWIRVIGGGLTGNWEAVGSGSGGFTSLPSLLFEYERVEFSGVATIEAG